MSQGFNGETQAALDKAQASYGDWQNAQAAVGDAKSVSDSATQALADATGKAQTAQQGAFTDAQAAIQAVAKELGVNVSQITPTGAMAQALRAGQPQRR